MLLVAGIDDRPESDDTNPALKGEGMEGSSLGLPEQPATVSAAEDGKASQGGGEFAPRFDSLISYPQAPADDAQAETPEPMDDPLSHKLEGISAEPGVYLLKDRNGKVLYVGKAKSLRSRVRAYFRENGDGRMQVRFLMKRVRDFDTLVARSEKEALILENNLIKQYKPRYNIRLKDDKSYLSAKITHHAWPRITVTRRIVKDGGRYIGPFGSADGLRETIDVIRKLFPLRTCSDGVFRNRSRPCIEYQIKRCLGPCCLPVDREEYERHLRAAQMLLEGKNLELLKEMRGRMKAHAERLEFEEAARVRDRVRAIEKTVERQTVLHHWGGDQDVFGLYRQGGFIEALVLMIRNGKLTSTQSWSFQDLEFPDDEVLADLLTQYYSGVRFLPDDVIVPVAIEDADVRAELLSERRERKVEFIVPQRGEKLRLLEMAMENAVFSPVQVAMIPIAERHVEYAGKVASQLRAAGVRVEVDSRNEKMNAKIREHAMQKVPFLLVVGDKESEANKVNVRTRGKEKTEDMATGEFVEKIKKLIAEKGATL